MEFSTCFHSETFFRQIFLLIWCDWLARPALLVVPSDWSECARGWTVRIAPGTLTWSTQSALKFYSVESQWAVWVLWMSCKVANNFCLIINMKMWKILSHCPITFVQYKLSTSRQNIRTFRSSEKLPPKSCNSVADKIWKNEFSPPSPFGILGHPSCSAQP